MIFSLTDLETHFSRKHYDKGWQLFTDNQVTAPNIQRGGELITAVIPQASKSPLRVYVRTSSENNAIIINGECSCAKKQNCEHVAAVLLRALDDQQALPDSKDIAIVKPFVNAPEKAKPAGTQQTLLYLLQFDFDGDTLQVETVVARRLKHGNYSRPRPFNPGRMSSHTPPRFLEPDDLALIDSLNQLPCLSDVGIFQLAGPQSAQITERIIATGRSYFEYIESGTPLRPGAARTLELHWQMDDSGYQRGKGYITPKATTLLPLSTPWYFDGDANECGPLNSDLPTALIYQLITLSPVPPEQAAETGKNLRKTWPDSTIPPLQVPEIETLPPVKPVPCLRLVTENESPVFDEWTEPGDVAYLSFAYKDDDGNDMKISRHAPPTCIRNGRFIHIQRDEKVEQAAVRQLRKLGFEEDDDPGFITSEDCFFLGSRFEDDDVEAWLNFQVEHLPALRAEGWRIEYDNFRYQLAEASHWTCDVQKLERQDWFDIALGVEVDGQRINLLPILLNFLGNFPQGLPDAKEMTTEYFIIPFDNAENEERLLSLPTARVLPLLEILLEIYHNADSTEHQHLHLSRIQLAQFGTLNQNEDGIPLQWLGDDDARQLVQRLRDLDGIPEVTPPTGLTATLRPYQQQGLNWLQFLREYQLAGILADDMGLGKTVQALAHLLLEKEAGRANGPSLVIAPTSLMFNWRHETGRFAPQLKVLVLHGPHRKQHFPTIADHDLIITTYPLLVRDKDTLLAHEYHLLILDEAQVIKNPKAQAGRVARDINARHRLCLTGTPMENHLGELWSLFDFLLPGLLGNSKQFRRFFRSPIEKHGNEETAERLSRRVRPFLLRRTKQQVATELPPKTEIVQTVMLEGKQRELYETVRLAMHRRVREEIRRQGLGRSHIVVLDALLKLRQVCCDPRLVKIDKAHEVDKSAKLDMLMELLPEMIEEGRRILLFSQFTTMLGFIEDELKKANIDYVKLTGRTRDRETPVKNFQDGKVPLFLISLKAGGVGLNLTAADTVIHYDPWWNPAVERQATDRAHRIGQQQTVFVYKFICEGTLEEKIQAMQQRKQALADGLYQSDGQNEAQWNELDLEALFQPLNNGN